MDCPKCNAELSAVHAEPITINAAKSSWHGVAYVCPACDVILSVGVDPMSLRNDLLDELSKRFDRK
jgi:uncharacterized protein with PIN domain